MPGVPFVYLGRSWQISAVFCQNLVVTCKNRFLKGPQNNDKSINKSDKFANERSQIDHASTTNPQQFDRNRFKKKLGSRDAQHVERQVCVCRPFALLGLFEALFWAEVGPKGGPQIMFLGTCRNDDEKSVPNSESRTNIHFYCNLALE